MALKKFIADSKMFENDKHYRDCLHNNQPFIKARINPSNGNYYVQIDLMTCNFNLSVEKEKKIKKIFENEIEFSKLNNLPNFTIKGYHVDKELSWFDGVLPKRLNLFCENLFDVSYDGQNKL